MEIMVPEVHESIDELVLAKWHKRTGAMVCRGELLCELETDKITIELNAETDALNISPGLHTCRAFGHMRFALIFRFQGSHGYRVFEM